MLHGTDISAFQPTTVPAGDFVIIKATQGTGYTNSKLAAQLADARKKGMLVGFYHFPEFGNDPLADGKHFCDVVAPLLKPGDKVILDHETYPSPGAAHAAAWGLKFLPYVERRCTRRPWVYANLDWAINGYCAGMGAYPYWCADPASPAGHPRVRGPFKTWIAHQYDISGVDRDVFNGTRADWLGATPQPQQEEDEMIARDVKPGMDAKTEFPIEPGKCTTIVGFGDNTFKNTIVKATGPVQLRVVVLHNDGTWQEELITVGQGLKDKATACAPTRPIKNPAKAVGVSVTRVDGDGTEPLTVGAY